MPAIAFLACSAGTVFGIYSFVLGLAWQPPIYTVEAIARPAKAAEKVAPILNPPPATEPTAPQQARQKEAAQEQAVKIDSVRVEPAEIQPLLPATSASTLRALSQQDLPKQPLPFTQVDSIMGLQTLKSTQRIANSQGEEITLTNVNPLVGTWYILSKYIGNQQINLHLEVAALHGDPTKRPKLELYRDGLVITLENEKPRYYPLWGSALVQASSDNEAPDKTAAFGDLLNPDRKISAPLSAICDGLVYIRSQKAGSATKLEVATDLLRETRLGEWVVATAKPYLIAKPEFGQDFRAAAPATDYGAKEDFPLDALVDEKQSDLYLTSSSVGIATDATQKRYYYGRWYKAINHPGIYVSVMKPTVAEKRILDSYPERVARIGRHDRDLHESEALVYLLAYDLSQFRFGYALGADHPTLEWSRRADKAQKTGKGPDGFDSKRPFATVGVVPPYYEPWVEGTFVGGFKREHSAFRTGALARINNGTHFGFMEKGVVFSRLLPGLATAAIGRDGSIDLLTWPEDAADLLPRLADARQNCLAIVQGFDSDGISVPGVYLNDWGAGSWSGDRDGDFVTLRAGLGIQEHEGRRFLLFGYFTAATPNAMARVFQAYRCCYGMLLDMNTANFCYAALYLRDAYGKIKGAEYLHKDMVTGNGYDGSLKFLTKNDTRDFFYLLRKY